MAASIPEIAIPLAVTAFPFPTFLSLNVGVPETVMMSPAMRSSEYVTVAVVVRSYTLLFAVMVTTRALAVMFAVVVAVVF